MTTFKRIGLCMIFIFSVVILTGIDKAKAQRSQFRRVSKFERLSFISRHPPIFFSVFTLPGKKDGQLLLNVTFNINYKLLTFIKNNINPERGDFYSPTTLTMDVFRAKNKTIRPLYKLPDSFNPDRRSDHQQFDVSNLTPVAHATWHDTAYAASFAQTTSPKNSLTGSMQVNIQPGTYLYLIQPGKSEGNAKFTHRFKVSSFSGTPVHNVILVRSVNSKSKPTRMQLMNLGSNVLFGQDFYAFIHLPHYKKGATYQVTIEKIRRRNGNIQKVKTVYQHAVTGENILNGIRPVLKEKTNGIYLSLKRNPGAYTYVLIKIPNHKFQNALYKLTLRNKKTSELTASYYYRSYWKNMPASLLSLDVAINMMKFIAPKSTIEKISSGSFLQRKRKFQNFWKSRDPTPKTVFNELQAEYYARIDSAYQKFSVRNTPGYNTSRGKVYIIYGPPQHKKRAYPPDGPTTIIWTYPSHKFVFRATTSFGNFKLVEQK